MKASMTQACFEIVLKSKSALFWASTLGLYFVASQYLFFLLSQKAWEAMVYKLLSVCHWQSSWVQRCWYNMKSFSCRSDKKWKRTITSGWVYVCVRIECFTAWTQTNSHLRPASLSLLPNTVFKPRSSLLLGLVAGGKAMIILDLHRAQTVTDYNLKEHKYTELYVSMRWGGIWTVMGGGSTRAGASGAILHMLLRQWGEVCIY